MVMKTNLRFFIVSIFLLIVDQVIKYLVSNFSVRTFGLGYFLNTNFSWSWPISNQVSAILSLLLLIGILFFYFQSRRQNFNPILFLVMAGAVSNLFDRVWRGGVVDYIFLPGGAIINLADVIIFVGVVWILLKTKSSHIHVS